MNVIEVPEELVTVLPFASLSVAVTVVVSAPLPVTVVGLAEQEICVAGPKTLIGAVAVEPPAVATTLHGWVAELVAVAAKRPEFVTAPHPPVTDQLTVEPVGAPVTVNCWVPPTGSDALDGERVIPPVAPGVVLIWK